MFILTLTLTLALVRAKSAGFLVFSNLCNGEPGVKKMGVNLRWMQEGKANENGVRRQPQHGYITSKKPQLYDYQN